MPLQNDHLLKSSTGFTTIQFIEKQFKAIIILTTKQAFKRSCMPFPQRANEAPKNALLQGSYRFLDPKFKTFCRLFCQNNNFFFQTQGYQIGDQ